MRLNRLAPLCLLLQLFAAPAWALTVNGGLGLGQARMSNESTETEGPLAQIWSVEQAFHSRLNLGVEHLRSFKTDLTTSASFTGLLGRYYFNAAPTKVLSSDRVDYDRMSVSDTSIFIGMGAGFGQSSRLPDDEGLSSNSAGFYVSPRFGVDYPLSGAFGLRGEAIYAMLISGKGELSLVTLGASLYWMF